MARGAGRIRLRWSCCAAGRPGAGGACACSRLAGAPPPQNATSPASWWGRLRAQELPGSPQGARGPQAGKAAKNSPAARANVLPAPQASLPSREEAQQGRQWAESELRPSDLEPSKRPTRASRPQSEQRSHGGARRVEARRTATRLPAASAGSRRSQGSPSDPPRGRGPRLSRYRLSPSGSGLSLPPARPVPPTATPPPPQSRGRAGQAGAAPNEARSCPPSRGAAPDGERQRPARHGPQAG